MTQENTRVACVGGGNLTKGLLLPLFVDAGYDVTIITMTDRSLQSLQGGYVIEEVDDTATRRREYHNFTVARLSDMSAEELASFSVMTTAVGGNNIPALAAALQKARLHPDLQILLCENDIECFRALHAAVPNVLATIVDRIVYSVSPGHVVAERYYSLEVFQKRHRPLPPFISTSKVFEQSFFKKRYLVNTLHAIIAWLGHAGGYTHINEALADHAIRVAAGEIAEELVGILAHKFPLAPVKEFTVFSHNALRRFAAPALNDPILRVGRNPVEKLGRGERVMEPICYARANGLKHSALLRGASYGLLFHASNEASDTQKDEGIFSYIEMS